MTNCCFSSFESWTEKSFPLLFYRFAALMPAACLPLRSQCAHLAGWALHECHLEEDPITFVRNINFTKEFWTYILCILVSFSIFIAMSKFHLFLFCFYTSMEFEFEKGLKISVLYFAAIFQTFLKCKVANLEFRPVTYCCFKDRNWMKIHFSKVTIALREIQLIFAKELLDSNNNN